MLSDSTGASEVLGTQGELRMLDFSVLFFEFPGTLMLSGSESSRRLLAVGRGGIPFVAKKHS